MLSRAEFLQRAGLVLAGSGLAGCTEVARRLTPMTWPEGVGVADLPPGDPAWRVLQRAAFGPRPGDVERVREMGVDAYLEVQLSPQTVEESPALQFRLGALDTLAMEADDARDFETATFPEVGRGQAARELQQATLLRAVYSERQLQEVLVEFWSDHFNVSQLKGECSWLKTVDDRLLRPHVLGRFRDLVGASARSPAMLFYLDNAENRKPDPETGEGPNENYARELLELHTLGIDGGYTLKDIQEVARCFTGWTYKKGLVRWPGDFHFEAGAHDEGPKVVLGERIPAGRGIEDGERVLDLVCRHPATALHLSRKLCRRFVADDPPEGLVRRVAEVFRKTDGDLRQVVSELLHSPEFRRGGAPRLKRPFRFTAAALRILNVDTLCRAELDHLERMGQLPFHWPMPDGYPERAEAWTSSLGGRWSFALDLAAGRVEGARLDFPGLLRATGETEPERAWAAVARLLLGRTPPPGWVDRVVISGEAPEEALPRWVALLLCSPPFQWC